MIKLAFFFHGYGSNGDDLSIIKNSLSKSFPEIKVLTPDAPFVCNQSENAFQWFSIDVLNPIYFMNGLNIVEPIIIKYIETEMKENNVKYDEVLLGGFSQGAALAMHLGLRAKEEFAGIVSLSGGLADSIETLTENIKSKPTIKLIHGDKDNVLPYAYAIKATKILDHFKVENNLTVIKNLKHSIDIDVLNLINKFIGKINNGI